MSSMVCSQPAQQMAFEAVVIRCVCGEPNAHTGQVCPAGVGQNLGTVAYWHKNPLKRLWYALVRRVAPHPFRIWLK